MNRINQERAGSLQANLDSGIGKSTEAQQSQNMKRVKLPIPQEYGGGFATGGTTEAAVANLIERIKSQAGFTMKTKAPLFKDCFDKWIALKEGEEKAETTLAGYKGVAKTHLIPFFEGKRIDEITPDDIQLYYNSIHKLSKSLSVQSKAILKGVFERAERNELISKNPMRFKYDVSRKEGKKVVLQDEDLFRVIQQLDTLKEPFQKDYLYACFLCFTGLRRGEILGLRWKDIDAQRMLIHVRQSVKYPNGQNNPVIGLPKDDSTGDVELLSLLWERISNYTGQPDEYIIAYSDIEKEKPITKSIFDKMFGRIKEKIDLNGATSHSFRHSYATMMQAHCESTDAKVLQGALRHKTPDLALKIYTETNMAKVRKAAQEYDSFLRDATEQLTEHTAESQTA